MEERAFDRSLRRGVYRCAGANEEQYVGVSRCSGCSWPDTAPGSASARAASLCSKHVERRLDCHVLLVMPVKETKVHTTRSRVQSRLPNKSRQTSFMWTSLGVRIAERRKVFNLARGPQESTIDADVVFQQYRRYRALSAARDANWTIRPVPADVACVRRYHRSRRTFTNRRGNASLLPGRVGGRYLRVCRATQLLLMVFASSRSHKHRCALDWLSQISARSSAYVMSFGC